MPEVHVTPAGLRIIKVLVGNQPQTIAELMRATDVTRTAVIGQLDHLIAGGFITRTIERQSGRGRPRHLYATTQSCLKLFFPARHDLVLPALWEAIEAAGGPRLTKKILKRVARSLADHYRTRLTAKDPKSRLRQFMQLLRQEGGLVETSDKNGELTMRKRSCPFITMIDEKRTVCRLDVEMLSLVVGCPVRCTACRHEGAPCCTFELAKDE